MREVDYGGVSLLRFVRTLREFAERPAMLIGLSSVDGLVGYVRGFDDACSGAALLGFDKWLRVRLNGGLTTDWSYLALKQAFPDLEYPELQKAADASREGMAGFIRAFADLYEEFHARRAERGGLTAILVEYEAWKAGKGFAIVD